MLEIFGLIIVVQGFVIYRNTFKIGYYEQKLRDSSLRDSVKGMPWYVLYKG